MRNRLLAFAQLAMQVSEQVLPQHSSKYSPRRYTQPQLLACLLLKEYLALDYRSTSEVLELSDGLRTVLKLRSVPDHTTLWYFARDKLTPEVIEHALATTVQLLENHPRAGPRRIALDSTGLETQHASNYFAWRRSQATVAKDGRRKRLKSWLKWAMGLWVEPQLLVAQRVRRGPAGDYPDLIPLTDAAANVLVFDEVLADAGYDSEANHAFCREVLGVHSIIPAKTRRCARVVATTPYRLEMVALFGPEGDRERVKAYGLRWLAETLMSVVKRKWGQALSARLEGMQQVQALLRGVVYNLYRLVLLNP